MSIWWLALNKGMMFEIAVSGQLTEMEQRLDES